MKTGTLTELKLSEVFKHEAHDFTPWLQENLDKLTPILGCQITRPDTEYRLDNFYIDIIAQIADNEEERVIIENQYGDSNHDHLGKLITYSSTVGAKAAVWIVENARMEHIAAINKLNVLNETQIDKCGFYLVEAKVVKIDDSAPAVIFNSIVEPSFKIKYHSSDNWRMYHKDFWSIFLDNAAKYSFKPYSDRTPAGDYWLNGKGYKGTYLCVSINKDAFTVKYLFDAGSDKKERNKQLFCKFEEHKEEIEALFGDTLDWRLMPECKSSMICKTYTEYGGHTLQREEWNKLTETMVQKLIALHKAISKFVVLID